MSAHVATHNAQRITHASGKPSTQLTKYTLPRSTPIYYYFRSKKNMVLTTLFVIEVYII